MAKKQKRFKKVLITCLTLLSFSGCLISSLFGGVFFQNNPIDSLNVSFRDECKKRECGAAVFCTFSYEFNDSNVNQIQSIKQTFNSSLKNQLSMAEYDCTISSMGYEESGITIVESKYYDFNYDTFHIYSDDGWINFKSIPNCVYVTTSLKKRILGGDGSGNIRGKEITLTANGISKNLTIGGTILTDIYPRYKGQAARADGMVKEFGEIIIVQDQTILDFNPTKAITMFAERSSVNGNKYHTLNNELASKGFELTFETVKDKSNAFGKIVSSIEHFFLSNQKIALGVVMTLVSILLMISFAILLKICINAFEIQDCEGRRAVWVSILLFGIIICVSVSILLIYRRLKLPLSDNASISLMNNISTVLFCSFFAAICAITFYKRKKSILSMFMEKQNNSEFDLEIKKRKIKI